MESSIEQQVLNQSPFAALFTTMVLIGTFVNDKTHHNATEETVVTPQENWCTNTSNIQEFLSPMPKGLGIATIIVTLIFPILPILVNSQTKMWNSFKFNIIKCHVVGQGSVFGVSELLRHFITVPEPMFLQKCNITMQECLFKSQMSSLFLSGGSSSNSSLCQTNSTLTGNNELFDSLHHFPDKTCCFIGASIVTFLTTLYFWNRINTKGKSIYNAHSCQQCLLILIQVICVSLVFIYLYFLYQTFEKVQVYGIFIGGLLQLMIYCSTLSKNDDENVVFLPVSEK